MAAGFSFGANKTTAPSGGTFQLPSFPASTAPSTSSIGSSVFPQLPTQTPQQQQNAAGPGLGGYTGSGSAQATLGGTQTLITTPKESPLPAELQSLVDALRAQIKTNKDISDALANANLSQLWSVRDDAAHLAGNLNSTQRNIRRLESRATALKDGSRQDLRHAEMVQRRQESLPSHPYGRSPSYETAQPMSYLQSLAAQYENLLIAYKDQLAVLENYIASRVNSARGGDQKPDNAIPIDELLAHIKRVDETFRYVASQVYVIHGATQDVKDQFLRHRRFLYGDSAANPFEEKRVEKERTNSTPKRLEGPHPFDTPSNSVLLGMAAALNKSPPRMGMPAPPTVGFGSGAQQQPSLFGTGTFGAAGVQQQPSFTSPFGSQQNQPNLFRPFSAATSAASSSSAFGAAPIAAVQPFKLTSSPFSTPSSGTIFGGTAANVGIARPFVK